MRHISKYINLKNFSLLSLAASGLWLASVISSCGKGNNVNAPNLNIRYQVLNLSPDVYPVDLYIKFLKTNAQPFYYGVSQGYFLAPYLDTPYVIRSAVGTAGQVLLSRSDLLKRNAEYTMFITGDVAKNTLTSIFTVDTASLPSVGRGKVRFVDASPSGAAGFDVYANGVKAFSNIAYPKFTDFRELPNGYYDFDITATGSTIILKTLTNVQILDGRLYTIYSYGYTNRTDTASFNAAVITNR